MNIKFKYFALFIGVAHPLINGMQEAKLIPFEIPSRFKQICSAHNVINGIKKGSKIFLNPDEIDPIQLASFDDLLQSSGEAGEPFSVGIINEAGKKTKALYLFEGEGLKTLIQASPESEMSNKNPLSNNRIEEILFFKYASQDRVLRYYDFYSRVSEDTPLISQEKPKKCTGKAKFCAVLVAGCLLVATVVTLGVTLVPPFECHEGYNDTWREFDQAAGEFVRYYQWYNCTNGTYVPWNG